MSGPRILDDDRAQSINYNNQRLNQTTNSQREPHQIELQTYGYSQKRLDQEAGNA